MRGALDRKLAPRQPDGAPLKRPRRLAHPARTALPPNGEASVRPYPPSTRRPTPSRTSCDRSRRDASVTTTTIAPEEWEAWRLGHLPHEPTAAGDSITL